MNSRRNMRALAALAVAAAAVTFGFAPNAWGAPITTVTTFSNGTPILIPAGGGGAGYGQADPYPSAIAVSGITDQVVDVNVTIENLRHTYPGDIYLVLEGPTGDSLLLWNDAGYSIAVMDIDVTFDDEADGPIDFWGPVEDGSYQVSQIMPPNGSLPQSAATDPAPFPGFGGALSDFDGLDANGDWKLWAYDDKSSHSGVAVDGWSITFETAPIPEPTAALLFGVGSLVVGGALRRRRA